MSTAEQLHQQDLQRLKSLRYMDDDFMTVCLADNFEGVELILRIVLGQKDIKVTSIRTQAPMKNLQGRSAVLDVHASSSTGKEFDSHILYVNGKYRGADEVGRLMHDFSCTNPDDMNYEALAGKARYFKQNEEGVAIMCKLMEDMRNEAAQQAEQKQAKKTALHLIKLGKISLEEIAEATELSLDIIKELEIQSMQLA